MESDTNDIPSVSNQEVTKTTEPRKRMTPEERRQKMEERNKKILEEGSKRIKFVTGETTTPRLGPQDKPAKGIKKTYNILNSLVAPEVDILSLLSGHGAVTNQPRSPSEEYLRLALVVFISFAVVFFTAAETLISKFGYLFLSWIAAECSIYSISGLINV